MNRLLRFLPMVVMAVAGLALYAMGAPPVIAGAIAACGLGMAVLTEGQHAEEFLVSEAAGERSRESITLISGQNLSASAVLGKITKGAASSAAYSVANMGRDNTGNGTMGAVTVSAGAKVGAYKLTIVEPGTNVGSYTVHDPDGVLIGVGVVAAAFSAGGLAFTLADGSTDFVAGDGFIITVAAGSGKYTYVDPEGVNGSETAVAILLRNVDASGGDVVCAALVRDCEVNADELLYSDADAGEIAAIKVQLASVGIICREAI